MIKKSPIFCSLQYCVKWNLPDKYPCGMHSTVRLNHPCYLRTTFGELETSLGPFFFQKKPYSGYCTIFNKIALISRSTNFHYVSIAITTASVSFELDPSGCGAVVGRQKFRLKEKKNISKIRFPTTHKQRPGGVGRGRVCGWVGGG